MSSASTIRAVRAWKILDSRGSPTIEVEIVTESGSAAVAAPSGKSVGKFEAAAFPDGGVDQAILQINNSITPRLIGQDAANQAGIDQFLHQIDGTPNFSRIGGNTAYAVSIACAFAAARAKELRPYEYLLSVNTPALPLPLGNVVGGGLHAASGALDIQEILVLPTGAKTPQEAGFANAKVHQRILAKAGREFHVMGKGDEGAWIVDVASKKAFEVVSEAAMEVSDESALKIRVGTDLAASALWDPKKQRYVYKSAGVARSPEKQLNFVTSLIDEYDLVYVEDPFHEEDFENFAKLRASAKKTLICGDDLVVTNLDRLKKAIDSKAISALIVKPNQVGTLTETKAVTETARKAGILPVASHRSGETTGTEIVHIALAFGSPILKCGVVGGERIAMMNQMIRIWQQSSIERRDLQMASFK
jgi:enolase